MKEIQGGLFSAEEMLEIEKQHLSNQTEGPVTCLGIEFENDEARRAYFRKELRKRLPELRKIEGFPIGEDDDIINLSDPPYYTACPNPWLNDFIAEWEKEKEQLEREGKRKADFEVKEPYAYDISQGKNSAIYNAHTYHTKVPHEVIMRYILHYTQPGDIVLDGFAGTGMTGVAASACKKSLNEINQDFLQNHLSLPKWGIRHSICGDLSPLCFHISSNYNLNVNCHKLKTVIESIINELKCKFNDYYEIDSRWGKAHVNYFVWSKIVACQNCGCELNIHDLTFDYKTKTLYKELKCPSCGTVQKYTSSTDVWETEFDSVLNKSVRQQKYVCCLMNITPKKGRVFSKSVPNSNLEKISGFIPTRELGHGYNIDQLVRTGCEHVHQIYAPRTQKVLSYLFELIHASYPKYRKELMFIFTSMLPKLTRLNRYMPQHGSRALVGPMANVLYLPPQYVENNPIDQFEYQAKKVLKAFAQTSKGAVVQVSSATNSSVQDNSIDYIFTDPPFGANIMYSELNTISESWLNVFTNNKEEAISNPAQNKGFPEYQEIMTRCFREYYRILKPGHWMTVEFSNTSAAFWNSLQYSIINAGFVISSITDLDKKRGGLYAMIGPTAVKQDLAISCYKPSSELIQSFSNIVNATDTVWNFISEHLQHLPVHLENGNATTSIVERNHKILYDRLISYYVQHGYSIPMDSQEFQAGLRERFIERDGMYFTASQAAEYEEKRKHTGDFIPMGIIVSDEANGIEWLKIHLKEPKSYQEISPEWMQAINGIKKGDVLPELKDILEENFIEDETGHWHVPDLEKQIDLEKLKHKSLMKEFNLYKEMAQKPRARIKEVRVEALREGFKQCFKDKDFKTILLLGDKIPQNILTEDEQLLQYYDIAQMRL